MNLPDALKALLKSPNYGSVVKHSQGDVYDLGDLIVNSEDDGSNWYVLGNVIERHNEDDQATGETYTVIE